MTTAETVRFDAPAKVNLALHVTGQRADGYHQLETLAVFTQFADKLSVRRANEDTLTVTAPFAGDTPAGAENIVMRALAGYRQASGLTGLRAAITLEKNLPVAAGIGGGSSDAAAVLRALDQLNGSALGLTALKRIGETLGADVAMCLHAAPLVAKGVGDLVEPVARFPSLALVLVNPGIAVATPVIFAALEQKNNPPLRPLPGTTGIDAICGWLARTRNDLEEPACRLVPQIAKARAELTAAGALFVRMSGSGATCFGIFSGEEEASRAAARIKADNPGWFTVATATGESGEIDAPD